MKKILPILGLVGRLTAILLLIGVIGSVGYVTYYYVAPIDAPRPVKMKDLYKDMLIKMLPYQRAQPPMTPTQDPNPDSANPPAILDAQNQPANSPAEPPTPQATVEGASALFAPLLQPAWNFHPFGPPGASG